MKQCEKCGFKFSDKVKKCQFCGNAVVAMPVSAPKPPQIQPKYAICNVCGRHLPYDEEKCRFCGGMCRKSDGVTQVPAQMTERQKLFARVQELGISVAGNISTQALKEKIQDTAKDKLNADLTECAVEELKALATDVGVELKEDDDKDSIIAKLKDTLLEGDDDDTGNNQANSTTGSGSNPDNNNG